MSTLFEVDFTEFSAYISDCYKHRMRQDEILDLSDAWLTVDAESIVDQIATVKNENNKSTLQVLFSSMGEDWITQVNVDGKPVNDRLQEMFDIENAKHVKETGSSLEWNQWHQDNKDKLGRRIVMAGLMAGKRVVAPKWDIQIQGRGYVPNELNPLALYAWKKYCNSLGFKHAIGLGFSRSLVDCLGFQYKDALQKQKYIDAHPKFSYELIPMHGELQKSRLMDERAMMETQKWIYAYNLDHADSPAMLNMFFGEHPRSFDNSAFQDASTAVAACICYLAAKNYTLEKILNLNELQKVKQEAAKEDLNQGGTESKRIQSERWLGALFFCGQQAILDQLDKLMKHTDWNDPRQRKAMLPILYGSGSALLHVASMVRIIESNIYTGYAGAAHMLQRGDAMNTLSNLAANVGTFAQALYRGEKARMTLAYSKDEASLKEAVADLATEQWVLKKQAANAGRFRPFRNTVPRTFDIDHLNGIAKESNVAKMFAEKVAQQQKSWKEKASDILAGFMNDAFIFQKDEEADTSKLLIATDLLKELGIKEATTINSPRIPY